VTHRDIAYIADITDLREIEGVCQAVDCDELPRLPSYEAVELERRAIQIGGDHSRVREIVTMIRARSVRA